MKLLLEIISLLTGGLFGSIVGAHFKSGCIEPWISRIMSILTAFVVVFGLIGEGYLKFNRTAFSMAFGIAFIIETLGQNEISKLLSKILKKKIMEVTKGEEKE